MANSERRLDGKVAVVTGGGRGIGRAIAIALALEGASVCVVARTVGQVEAVANEVGTLGGSALAVVADVTDSAQVRAMAERVAEHYGRVDILVNNAGGSTSRTTILESSQEDWTSAIRLNIDSVYLVSRALVPLMTDSGGGRIINIGSGMGHSSGPTNSSYRVGKAGAWMLTQCMAEELWDYAIEVNELVPGPVVTDATSDFMKVGGPPPFAPSERVKLPAEVASLAVWLATQPPGGPTGQSFSLARRPL